jgi:hypothetical protein
LSSAATTERSGPRPDGPAGTVRGRTVGLWSETALATVAFLLFGLVVYLRHILHGGLYADDWEVRAITRFAGDSVGAQIDSLVDFYKFRNRPSGAVYVALVEHFSGARPSLRLAGTLVENVLMSAGFYALLRIARLPRLFAFAAGALVLLWDGADTVRLWWLAGGLAIAVLAVMGAWLLVLGPRRSATKTWVRLLCDVVSLALLAFALTVYESVLPFVLLSVLVYRLRYPWRAAVRRWIPDVVLGLLVYVTVTRRVVSPTQPLGDTIDHGRTIADAARRILTDAVFPFGSGWIWTIVVVLLLGASLAVLRSRRRLPRVHPYLLAFGAGILVVACGYATYVPAQDYYTPDLFGTNKRINGLAAFGYVLILLSSVAILVEAVVALAPEDGRARVARGGVVVAGLAVAALGVSYAVQSSRDVTHWTDATKRQDQILSALRNGPRPPRGTHLFVFGVPGNTAPLVPVFSLPWDLYNATRLVWNDPSLAAYPVTGGARVTCGATGVEGRDSFAFKQGAGVDVPYGSVWFVDGISGKRVPVNDPPQCRKVLRGFAPGPDIA